MYQIHLELDCEIIDIGNKFNKYTTSNRIFVSLFEIRLEFWFERERFYEFCFIPNCICAFCKIFQEFVKIYMYIQIPCMKLQFLRKISAISASDFFNWSLISIIAVKNFEGNLEITKKYIAVIISHICSHWCLRSWLGTWTCTCHLTFIYKVIEKRVQCAVGAS